MIKNNLPNTPHFTPPQRTVVFTQSALYDQFKIPQWSRNKRNITFFFIIWTPINQPFSKNPRKQKTKGRAGGKEKIVILNSQSHLIRVSISWGLWLFFQLLYFKTSTSNPIFLKQWLFFNLRRILMTLSSPQESIGVAMFDWNDSVAFIRLTLSLLNKNIYFCHLNLTFVILNIPGAYLVL